LIVSEAVMMELGPHLGRQRAHDVVYDVCRRAITTGRRLPDVLAENSEIAAHLDRAGLDSVVRSGELSWPGRRHG
jgi:3-carboxy-cis,cis-muconate cycloisomerase